MTNGLSSQLDHLELGDEFTSCSPSRGKRAVEGEESNECMAELNIATLKSSFNKRALQEQFMHFLAPELLDVGVQSSHHIDLEIYANTPLFLIHIISQDCTNDKCRWNKCS